RAPVAASLFATIFANFPHLESEIGPAALAKSNPADGDKFFRRKMMLAVHPDRTPFNIKDASDAAMGLVSDLIKIYTEKQITDWRVANGWTTADAVENGNRTWILKPDTVFTGGKNERSNPRMDHNTVSRQHFRLQFQNGTWVLENLNSTYGTYVNGNLV